MFRNVRRHDPNTSSRFTRKVNKIMNNYKWPLPKKNPTVEEQILSPLAREPKLLKTDMSLNTLIEASKQIKNAIKQTQVYSPSAKPVTPFTVTTASFGKQSPFATPRSSITIANLMNNGLSYPAAKKLLKHSPVNSTRKAASLVPAARHSLYQSSIHSVDEDDAELNKS